MNIGISGAFPSVVGWISPYPPKRWLYPADIVIQWGIKGQINPDPYM